MSPQEKNTSCGDLRGFAGERRQFSHFFDLIKHGQKWNNSHFFFSVILWRPPQQLHQLQKPSSECQDWWKHSKVQRFFHPLKTEPRRIDGLMEPGSKWGNSLQHGQDRIIMFQLLGVRGFCWFLHVSSGFGWTLDSSRLKPVGKLLCS